MGTLYLIITKFDRRPYNANNSLNYSPGWVHAERLIHKLVGFNESQRRAIERTRARVMPPSRPTAAKRRKAALKNN